MSYEREKSFAERREYDWPADHDTEEKLLAGLLSANRESTDDCKLADWAFGVLDKNDFDFPFHRYFFTVLRGAWRANVQYKPTSLAHWILRHGDPEEAKRLCWRPWPEQVCEFFGHLVRNQLFLPWHIELHCKRLRVIRLARARRIVGEKIYASALAADTADEFSTYVTEQMDLLAKVKPL